MIYSTCVNSAAFMGASSSYLTPQQSLKRYMYKNIIHSSLYIDALYITSIGQQSWLESQLIVLLLLLPFCLQQHIPSRFSSTAAQQTQKKNQKRKMKEEKKAAAVSCVTCLATNGSSSSRKPILSERKPIKPFGSAFFWCVLCQRSRWQVF